MTTLGLNVQFTMLYLVFFMKILCSRGGGSSFFLDANHLLSNFKKHFCGGKLCMEHCVGFKACV